MAAMPFDRARLPVCGPGTLTVCAEPGCPELVAHGSRCAKHRRTAKARGWPKVRAAAMATTRGRCAQCGAPATVVHHLDAIADGGAEVADLARLVALCHTCHRQAHDPTRRT